MEAFIEACRAHGLRVTPQRCAVYREVVRSRIHPTAEQVFRKIRKAYPAVSYDTVNRTLLALVRMGLVDVVKSPGAPRRFDGAAEQHHHFLCVECGAVVDFHEETYDRLEIPSPIREKFTVFSKRVVLNGLCEKCRRRVRTAPGRRQDKTERNTP